MPSTTSLQSPAAKSPDLLHVATSQGWDLGSVLAWLGTGIGFGLVSGWVVGFVLKKVALVAAFILGVIFIVIQLMVVNRFISVNWPAVAEFFGHAAKQMGAQNAPWWKMLIGNFPYAGSFGVGFFLGFRKG